MKFNFFTKIFNWHAAKTITQNETFRHHSILWFTYTPHLSWKSRKLKRQHFKLTMCPYWKKKKLCTVFRLILICTKNFLEKFRNTYFLSVTSWLQRMVEFLFFFNWFKEEFFPLKLMDEQSNFVKIPSDMWWNFLLYILPYIISKKNHMNTIITK